MTQAPKIFISYAWEDQKHQDRVLALADWFEINGCEVIFDQYDPNPKEGWPHWMEQAIKNADFVICVCTKAYHDRVTHQTGAHEGLGCQWEGSLIYNAISNKTEERNKFQVFQFDSEDKELIPQGLLGGNRYAVRSLEINDPRLEALYRLITDQPVAIRPMRGDIVRLPSRERTAIPRSGSTDFTPLIADLEKTESHYGAELRESIETGHNRRTEVNKVPGKGTLLERLAKERLQNAYRADESDDYDAVVLYAQQALKLNRTLIPALRMLCRAYYELHRYQEALPLLEDFVKRAPNEPLPYFQLLVCRDKINGTESAIREAEKSLGSWKDHLDAKRMFASICCDVGEFKKAIETFEKILAESESDSDKRMLAVYYWFDGNTARSMEILELLPQANHSAMTWTNIAVGRAEMGRFGMAIEAINQALRLGSKSKFLIYAYAEIYALMGEAELAVSKLNLLRDGGTHYLARAKTERTFNAIRHLPEFIEFLKTI